MRQTASKRASLVHIVSELARKYRDELEEIKSRPDSLERPDFVWHSFLEGSATMGNANGYAGLIDNRENYEQVGFDRLASLPPDERAEVIERVLRKAKVRWPGTKSRYLASNVQRIIDLGGVVAAKEMLLNAAGREGKMAFLTSFAGVGPKYARTVLMGVYHEEFRESIAIDARIKRVTNALGLTFPNYQVHEDFYLEVAREAGLNGLELDSILYNHTNEVIKALDR